MTIQPTYELAEFARASTIPKTPEGDYPDVSREIVTHVRTRLAALGDELREFLDARQEAAPTTVSLVRVLDSLLCYETDRWFEYWAAK